MVIVEVIKIQGCREDDMNELCPVDSKMIEINVLYMALNCNSNILKLNPFKQDYFVLTFTWLTATIREIKR